MPSKRRGNAPKKRRKSRTTGSLWMLADFLNFDFNSLNQKDPHWLYFNSYDAIPDAVFHLLTREFPSEDWVEQSKQLKAEIIADLKPLMPDSTHEIQNPNHLKKLIRKIKGLGLKSDWSVEIGDYYLSIKGPYGPQNQEKVINFRNPAQQYLGPGHKILEIGGTKCILRHFYDVSSSREELYGIVISALENNSFALFRMCKECRKFFVAQDPRQIYCSRNCTESFHGKDAKNRMRKWREYKEKKMRKKYLRE